jgi:hypothetical protein
VSLDLNFTMRQKYKQQQNIDVKAFYTIVVRVSKRNFLQSTMTPVYFPFVCERTDKRLKIWLT